jgi:hypothetical protein
MELGGGGAQARREEGKSGDWCGRGRAKASTFYRGRREAETVGESGAAVVMAHLHYRYDRERRGQVQLS